MRSITALAATLLLPATLIANEVAPINGPYRGVFGYEDPSRPRTNFTLQITEVSGGKGGVWRIAGNMNEPRADFGPKNLKTLTSHFAGTWTADGRGGAKLNFTKVYDYDGHKVSYTGKFDWSEGNVIGHWSIGSITGPFTMHLTGGE